MKHSIIILISVAVALCFASCDKSKTEVETIIPETEAAPTEEESLSDVQKSIIWDAIDGFEAPFLFFSYEEELLNKVKNAPEDIYSVKVTLRESLDSTTNVSESLLDLSREQIFKVIENEWQENFQVCIMEQEGEYKFADDEFVHFVIEFDLCKRMRSVQESEDKVVFPISLKIYKNTPAESLLEVHEKVRVLKYLLNELECDTNYAEMSDDELIAKIEAGKGGFCLYLSKEQIYELMELDWPKDSNIWIIWEDTDILR